MTYWRTIATLVILPFLLWAQSAWAAVTITFYSHDFGSRFPHAFIHLTGNLDANGAPVDIGYGFTAVNVSPAILFGSVRGKVESPTADYIARSNPHFSLVLTDQQYGEVLDLVQHWRDKPQKNYNLNRSNCVHFVGEFARLLGLETNAKSRNFKKPKSYLNEVMTLNPELRLSAG